MGSINIERYTADTYKHAPNSVCIGARVVTAILDKNNNKATDTALLMRGKSDLKQLIERLNVEGWIFNRRNNKTTKNKKRSQKPALPGMVR